MKKQITAVLFAGACVCLGSLSADAQLRILPYGDSVTSFGSSPESSYRYWLFTKLTDAGFQFQQDFVFVGTRSGTEDGPPQNDWPAEQYSGGEGQTSFDAATAADAVANATQPDVVLLDFGSNDFDQSWETLNASATRTNIDLAIEAFRAQNPNVIILLAKPTGWVTGDRAEKKFQSALSGAIGKAAQDEKKAGAHVVVVNLRGGFNAQKDTKDGTHPNVRGEQKIANKYFSALKKILK